VLNETVSLKKRYDDLSAECSALRQKLAQLVERTNGFIPTTELEADKDDDAAEIAALEAELAEVEAATDVANHEHKTYHLMIERIRGEAETYRRDLSQLDMHVSAKHSDSEQLQLMLKDATDVRDAARSELLKEDEALSVELAALAQRLSEKQEKLSARRQQASEHEARTSEKVRGLEREKAVAALREQKIRESSIGSLDSEREQISKLQGVFDTIAESLGVSDPEAIVEKFKGQEETFALLSNLHRTSRAKIEKLHKDREEKRKTLEMIRLTANSANIVPLPPKPGAVSADAEEEARLKEQRAVRLARSRAKRIAATELEARSALEQLSIMVSAAAETDALSSGASQAAILNSLRPGAQVPLPSTAPLKASELQPGDIEPRLSASFISLSDAHHVDSRPTGRKSPGGGGGPSPDRPRQASMFDVASAASGSQTPAKGSPNQQQKGKGGTPRSTPGSRGADAAATAAALLGGGSSRGSSPPPKKQPPRRAPDELSKSFEFSVKLLERLIADYPSAAALVSASGAAAADADAAGAVDVADGLPGDALQSEVGLAPLLIAAGGEAPFALGEAELGEAAKKDVESEEDDEEEDGGEVEPILDREALKSQARRIVQKRHGKLKGGRRRKGGVDDD
jgi:regulator of replication initiation timing